MRQVQVSVQFLLVQWNFIKIAHGSNVFYMEIIIFI